ncbi:DUF4123 domain-containing protein [Rhodovulum sulfidophilum]|uniref:DUF4123 domain-containing protein n=1 Tax=Rhodovulum sulfidophilum TaxID=35806 RepID=UPI001924569F|nr:DUF4123 domain-containing protein [Rhodovulum sulfidophilum]
MHAEQSTHTFAILDATKIPDLPDTLANSGLTYLNLFRGTAAQELVDVSPYTVKLEIENDFAWRIFTDTDKKTGLWSNEVGIYVRSKDAIEIPLRLFRKFTQVRDEHYNSSYFRFWEPDVGCCCTIEENSLCKQLARRVSCSPSSAMSCIESHSVTQYPSIMQQSRMR